MPLYENSPGSVVPTMPTMGAACCTKESNLFYITSDIQIIGGDIQIWNIESNVGHFSRTTEPQLGMASVISKCDLQPLFECKNPNVLDPAQFNGDLDAFLDRLQWWFTITQRKSINTFKKRRNLIKSLSAHPVYPVDFFDLKNQSAQVIHCLNYVECHYSKNTARSGKDAIRNLWHTIEMVGKATGVETDKWNYRPPQRARINPKLVPTPKIVHKLIHHQYSTDRYTNSLIQHLMLHSFLVGWRFPSEPAILKLDDVHLDEGYIDFYQPKVNCRRMSPLEQEVMTYPNRKSFKNWLDVWRPKVENQHSKDFVYLQASGKPFTANYLRNRINDMGKRVWPHFHPYTYRDTCAVARLIKTKVDTGSYDIYTVCDFLGHSKISITESYVKSASKFYQLAPFDWVRFILKFRQLKDLPEGDNEIKPENGEIGALPIEIPGEPGFKHRHVRTLSQEEF